MASVNVPEGRMLDGTARILLAESLFPLTALLTVAFLTRHLGPSKYGLLSLTLTALIWIESALLSFFSKATIKWVGERTDWQPLGGLVIRRSLIAGCGAMVLVWGGAAPISAWLKEPELAWYFCVAALDIPILCVAQAYRSILIGTGQFQGGAVPRAARWVCRLGLVVLFVLAGLSIPGVLLGVIGSSLVELLLCRWYLGPVGWWKAEGAALPIHWYGTMLFLSSMCVMVSNGMDLFMLKMIEGTAGQAGIYGSAQSLAFLPALFSLTFSPVLLATLSRLVADAQCGRATMLGRDAMRMTLWLLPAVAIIAGSSHDIVLTVFGSPFVPAAPLLSLLIIGGLANVFLIVSLTIMTAMGYPARTVVFSAPLIPLAVLGHLVLIPQMGAQGAALTTLMVSCLGAAAALWHVAGAWGIWPPLGTVLRSALLGLVMGTVSASWSAPGVLVFGKLLMLGSVSLVCYWILREFRVAEVAFVRSWISRKAATADMSCPPS